MNTERTGLRRIRVLLAWMVLIGIFSAVVYFVWRPKQEKKLEEDTGSASQYNHRLTLLADSYSGYAVFRSEQMAADLRKNGIKLTTEDCPSYNDRQKKLADGDAEFAMFTIDSDLKSGVVGMGDKFPGSMCIVVSESQGADGMVAYKTAIPNLRDGSPTKGFVGVPDSPNEYLMRIAVADLTLPGLPDVWFKPEDYCNDGAEVYKRFKNADRREAKAYVLWEPYLSMALQEKDAVLLLDSSSLKGHILDVLVVERNFLRDHPDVVAEVVKSYFRALYSNTNSGMAALIVKDGEAVKQEVSKTQADAIAKKIWWKNTMENYAHFSLLADEASMRGLETIEDMVAKIARTLKNTGGFGSHKFQTPQTSLYYDGILAGLQSSGFHPAQKVGALAASQQDEVRGYAAAQKLTEQQWSTLMPLGQLQVKRIEFARGSATLTKQGTRDLEELGRQITSYPTAYLRIIGYARGGGEDEQTRALASQRAAAAASYLQRTCSIDENRIHVEGRVVQDDSALTVEFQLGQRPY